MCWGWLLWLSEALCDVVIVAVDPVDSSSSWTTNVTEYRLRKDAAWTSNEIEPIKHGSIGIICAYWDIGPDLPESRPLPTLLGRRPLVCIADTIGNRNRPIMTKWSVIGLDNDWHDKFRIEIVSSDVMNNILLILFSLLFSYNCHSLITERGYPTDDVDGTLGCQIISGVL